MDKRPTLLFMTSRFPYPLEKGDKLRTYHLIKGLSKSYQIHLYALSTQHIEPSWQKELAPYVVSIHLFRLNVFTQCIRLIGCIFTNQPFQLAYFTSFRVKRIIKKSITNLSPDHIFCQMIRPAEYVKNYHRCNKTIDYMDALSVGMERRAKKAPWYLRWIFNIEAVRLKEYEQRIFNYFEFQTMISQQDVHYIAHPDQGKIRVVPNGIDTEYFHPIKNLPATYDLVFVGNLSYAPNIDAMRWFADHIISKYPTWTLLIAGANPSSALVQALKKYPNITIEGWQEDIRKAYARGKLFIAPMQIGTGMQNKLLEAMAMGIPCLTTPLASEALEIIPGRDLMVGNNSESMADQIVHLLENPEEAGALGNQGRQTVQMIYSWNRAVNSLIEIITPQH